MLLCFKLIKSFILIEKNYDKINKINLEANVIGGGHKALADLSF